MSGDASPTLPLTPASNVVVESSSCLTIPETRDGFYGYTDEKSLQQMVEHKWAQRHTSDVAHPQADSTSLSASFTLSSIGETPQIQATEELHPSHFSDDEDKEQISDVQRHMDTIITPELARVVQSFQKCLELRDKYITKSLQRLGDNPRDHDGVFHGVAEGLADVSGVKPDVNQSLAASQNSPHEPWVIYPKPPPPHWHFAAKETVISADGRVTPDDQFEFSQCQIPGNHEWVFEIDDKGVYQIYTNSDAETKKPLFDIPTIREYFVDLDYVLGVISDGPAKSMAYRRLKYLASKFEMYSLLNEFQELADMKVDTHVHLASCMNQKHLLRFIKSKMKRSPHDVVIFRDGTDLTLEQVFQSLKLSAYDLSINTLDMHAHQDSFHRFDQFNLKYNPIGESRLREIFLKIDNKIDGRYFAEITRGMLRDNCEWRVSIYGRSVDEWDKLAKWIINNDLFSHNVRWLIQVPRLYQVYKETGALDTFEEIVINVFRPLFEVTKDPKSHPELHVFLQRVVGFDSVDDESKAERRFHRKFPFPRLWDSKQNPPFSYWMYYMYANMASLNHWRKARGFNTFVFRPHAGEAGDTDHLTAAFLTSHSISHGILLRKVPALQYLFYLKQIGLAMSPLSNNALFLTYERNPLPDFFKVGLESHIYKLPQSSLAELARNSVIQSGFEMEIKRHWLGQEWYLPGAAGNDIHKTNVPNLRLAYRHRILLDELAMIKSQHST
ncbi:AMP deaminase [Suillus subalutaceus]|uniref:AMP deaminase n=1 Tax=Suillus subalutaceus TaxID=48586 RepID=UPI001B87DC6C|nr:AMP deaminase [Suillus subalutaceus]KAG1836358.1 AMP deaminase [Suillus subalutaceus]